MSFGKMFFSDNKLVLEELSRKDIELEKKNNEIVRLLNLLSQRDEIVKQKKEIVLTIEIQNRQEEKQKMLEIL